VADIPEGARKFIARHIDSLEKLEVLLLLLRSPERKWTASAVASELQIGSAAADQHLGRLCAQNLLDVKLGEDLFYFYSPRLPHLDRGARELASAYAQQRLAVLKLVTNGAAGPARDFAEAFRINKKDDSDG
jgi:hypothetical protein